MGGNSGIDLFILERVDYGMTPRAYTDFQVTIRDFCTANRLVKSVDVIEAIDDPAIIKNYELFAMFIKSPTFLISDRIMIDAKYVWKEDCVVIVSSLGCEVEKEEYCRTHDLRGLELAVNVLSAMKFFPVFKDPEDETSEIIGTRTIFVNESDFGGSVPKWLVQKFLPKSIHEMYEDVVVTTRQMSGLGPAPPSK